MFARKMEELWCGISRNLVTGTVLLLLAATSQAENQGFNALRIAHAGGGIRGKTYTNSYDALDLNIQKGFRYFEIDFSFTRDNKLVCIHDWEDSFRRSFGFEAKQRPTLETFRSLASNESEFNKCTLEGLADWMRKNSSAILITDVKERNMDALQMIIELIPDAENRVIPQIYQPMNFSRVKDMGYESVIWTLYRFRGSNYHVTNWVDTFSGPFAVTMPEKRAQTGLPASLKEKHVPTYVHTINDRNKLEMYLDKYGLTEIYTDTLLPGDRQQDDQHCCPTN